MKICTVMLLVLLSGCASQQQPLPSYSEPSVEWSKEVHQACREAAAEVMVEAYLQEFDADVAAIFSRNQYLRCMDHFGLVI